MEFIKKFSVRGSLKKCTNPKIQYVNTIPGVTLLINFIPPYHLPTFRLLNDSPETLRFLVSLPWRKNRDWSTDRAVLYVEEQKNFTIARVVAAPPQGFTDKIFIHIPYATLHELYKEKPDVIISTEMGVRSLMALAYRYLFRSVRLILWLPLSEHTEKGRGWLRILVRWLFMKGVQMRFLSTEKVEFATHEA